MPELELGKLPGYRDTYKSEHLERALVDLAPTIRHDANDNLLPSVGTPHLRLRPAAQMCDVLEHARKYPSIEQTAPATADDMNSDSTYAFIVRQKSTSSSLYIVITINSSVLRPYR